jgi:hypothetical protein
MCAVRRTSIYLSEATARANSRRLKSPTPSLKKLRPRCLTCATSLGNVRAKMRQGRRVVCSMRICGSGAIEKATGYSSSGGFGGKRSLCFCESSRNFSRLAANSKRQCCAIISLSARRVGSVAWAARFSASSARLSAFEMCSPSRCSTARPPGYRMLQYAALYSGKKCQMT